MDNYDEKNKKYISEFSEKCLIYRAYFRNYKKYNKIVSPPPLYSIPKNALYILYMKYIRSRNVRYTDNHNNPGKNMQVTWCVHTSLL